MERQDSLKTKLFFHMGPGFHSQIERDLYSKSYPTVDFWDQPKCKMFSELVEHAVKKALEMSQDPSQKISIIAHSFGGQIARQLILKIPDKIDNITLLNSAFDPFECFINIYNALSIENRNSEQVDIDKLKNSTTSKKIEFIINLSMSPYFSNAYWTSNEIMTKYHNIFQNYSPLDVSVFLDIFTDYLNQYPISVNKKWVNSTKIYYSIHDKLIDFKNDIPRWNTICESPTFIALNDCGHYSHIESRAIRDLLFT